MFQFLKRFLPKQVVHIIKRDIRGRYDAAQTGHENENHWAAADSLGPIASNETLVRNKLAYRARYERDNNPHLYGGIRLHGLSFVGTGPRLQLSMGESLYASTRKVETDFAKWAKAIRLADKLRQMVEAAPIDGESFAQFIVNPRVEGPVKLDLRVIETEQIKTPDFRLDMAVDGIEIDDDGNVVNYHLLDEHPGDAQGWTQDYTTVPVANMLHWLRRVRAGQYRGVSELASSLDTCGQTRRYAKATLGKQELNANIAGVIESDNILPDTGDAPTFETMEEIDIPRMGLMTMPAGMKAKPFDTAQNATGYREYMMMNHGATARPILLPLNYYTGDSSNFNFASGRMDHLPYQASVWSERERFETEILSKVIRNYYRIASEAGLIPADLPRFDEWSISWHWDGFPSLDQKDDEHAREVRLKNGISTLSEECAAEGKDWREVARQQAAERDYYVQLGLDDPYAVLRGTIKPPMPDEPSQGSETIDDEDDTTLEKANARYARV
jgi:capsid protein